jgi:hypothetical protein
VGGGTTGVRDDGIVEWIFGGGVRGACLEQRCGVCALALLGMALNCRGYVVWRVRWCGGGGQPCKATAASTCVSLAACCMNVDVPGPHNVPHMHMC